MIRSAIATTLLVAGLAGLAGCAGPATTGSPDATQPAAGVTAAPSASATTGPGRAFGRDLTCPGDVWPPFGVPGTFDGIVARSTDRFHVEVRNTTVDTVYVRVSGWEVVQLETCRGLVELEAARGPVGPGAAFIADLPSDPLEAPLTVGIWREPCGEACREEPVALLPVSRSTVQPASS